MAIVASCTDQPVVILYECLKDFLVEAQVRGDGGLGKIHVLDLQAVDRIHSIKLSFFGKGYRSDNRKAFAHSLLAAQQLVLLHC